jgi:glycosyltransferase involved in cell wall biosynthesis
VHSSYMKSLVLAEYEVPPERIRVVPPVLRESFLESIPEDSQNETILTVTRLVRGKGIERALRAVDALRRQLPEIRYLIVGDGPMIGKYKQLATELGLERCVKFVGEVPPTEVHRYYEKCTVYLLPSLLESFGISKIEANACGKPVIAANADGVREGIVHGVNGFLFNNDEEIPYYILKLLTDSKLLRSMQSNAKEASREYSPASYVSRMSRIYSTVS